MKLRDLGEHGLIARIARAAEKRPAGALRLGIGDDAAILRARAGEDLVASTDASVEGVHFRFANESARSIGRRALVANLSDLAAMGARPLGFLWALAAPPELEVRTVDGMLRGLLDEAEQYGCPLAGGNCTAAPQVSLTLTVLGAVKRGRALTRNGARAGDAIFVTGVLGAAALDRARAEGGGRVRHVATPRLAAGRALARLRGVGGCVDVSDGLEADMAQLLAPAGLEAEFEAGALPLPRGFAAAAARLGLDAGALALRGGEDYELLFTLRPDAGSAERLSRRLGVPVARLGRVVPRARRGTKARGFEHFSP